MRFSLNVSIITPKHDTIEMKKKFANSSKGWYFLFLFFPLLKNLHSRQTKNFFSPSEWYLDNTRDNTRFCEWFVLKPVFSSGFCLPLLRYSWERIKMLRAFLSWVHNLAWILHSFSSEPLSRIWCSLKIVIKIIIYKLTAERKQLLK